MKVEETKIQKELEKVRLSISLLKDKFKHRKAKAKKDDKKEQKTTSKVI